MDMKQVNKYRGERVVVNKKTGERIEGALVFFNWEQQVIHLSSYIEINKEQDIVDEGKFIVVNQREWETMRIK